MARSGLNRTKVLQAAQDLLDQKGFTELTVANLAVSLGIRPPSLYNHVESLADIRNELSIRVTHEMAEVLRKATAGKTLDEAVLAMGLAYRQYAKGFPGRYSLAALAKVPSPEGDRAYLEVRKVFLETISAYGFSKEREAYAVRAIRSAIHGFVTLEINGGWLGFLSPDQSFIEVLKIVIQGMKNAD